MEAFKVGCGNAWLAKVRSGIVGGDSLQVITILIRRVEKLAARKTDRERKESGRPKEGI